MNWSTLIERAKRLNWKNAGFRFWLVCAVLWEIFLVYVAIQDGPSLFLIWAAIWPIVFLCILLLLVKAVLWVFSGFKEDRSLGYSTVERFWYSMTYEKILAKSRQLYQKSFSGIKMLPKIMLFLLATLLMVVFITSIDRVSLILSEKADSLIVSKGRNISSIDDPWTSFPDAATQQPGLRPRFIPPPPPGFVPYNPQMDRVAVPPPPSGFVINKTQQPGMIEVELPDGTIAEFPVGMTKEAMVRELKSFYAPQAPVPVSSAITNRGPSLSGAILIQLGMVILFRKIILNKKNPFLLRMFVIICVSVVLDRILYGFSINQFYPYLSFTGLSIIILLFMWTRNIKRYCRSNNVTDVTGV